MNFGNESASILCVTIGLGLSQNFAVSAAGEKICQEYTWTTDRNESSSEQRMTVLFL